MTPSNSTSPANPADAANAPRTPHQKAAPDPTVQPVPVSVVQQVDAADSTLHNPKRAVLSLGSNLGNRLETLQGAIDALVKTTLPPGSLLERAHAIEEAFHRVRDSRYGPRTIDVDIVAYQGVVSDDPSLTLPHPRAHERAFVLVPWHDVDPGAEVPGRGPVADLLPSLAGQGVVRRDDLALVLPE